MSMVFLRNRYLCLSCANSERRWHIRRQQAEKSKTFCARRTDEPLALADSTYAEVELGSVRAPVPFPDERPLILL
jgi:hypothetical protein